VLKLVGTTLNELIELQKQLLNYAEQKRTILIERKIDDLNRLVKEEAKLVKQLEHLENERVKLVEDVMQNHSSLSFSQFVDQLPDEKVKQNLQFQLKTLQQFMLDLQSANRVNETILKDSMSFVHHMIDQVTKSKQQHFNYQSPLDQQKSQTSSRGFFDTKA